MLSDSVNDYGVAGSSPPPIEKQPSVVNARPGHRPRSKRHLLRTVLMHLIGWPLVVLVIIAILAEAGMLVVLLGERDYTNRIYPNISIRGVDLGNQSAHSAYEKLSERYAAFLSSPVRLSYGSHTWNPTAAELGISLDIENALQEALSVGRSQSRMDNTRTIAAVWEHGLELPIHLNVDQQTMQRYLLSVASEAEQRPRNARVALEGPRIILTPERVGTQLLIDETIKDITAAVQHLEPQTVELRTRKLMPVVRDEDLTPVVAELRTLLSDTIVLTTAPETCSGHCQWEWTPQHIARWLTLVYGQTPDGHPTTTVRIDQTAIRNELVPIAEELRKEGTLPRLTWNDGQLSIFQPGLPGRGLDVVMAQTHINEALAGGPRTFQAPMLELPPPVNELNLATLGLHGPVSVGVSSFRNSQRYRITNIQTGARTFHGMLIPPGGTFSFNETLGPVDSTSGFVKGAAIVDNRVQQEWGGGLCQVSTTMFRAAFWAGLPIVERHSHQFRIGWYEELGEPPGFDAAIYTGASDLRFINDSGGWLLIQTWADLNRQRLYITLYGPDIDRHVEMSHKIIKHLPKPRKSVTVDDPSLPAGTFKQTDWAQPGLVVEVYRHIWENGTLTESNTFYTTFEAWPNIYVRGTGR